jgi:hypothetical protein
MMITPSLLFASSRPSGRYPASLPRNATGLALVVTGLLAVLGSACHGSSSTGSATTPTTPTVVDGPAVTLTPSVLTFTSVPPIVPQAVTLTNSGNAALTITSVVASGSFVETDNCVTSLDAGASCTINVSFVPLVIGTTGTVTITDDASTSPQMLSLVGPNVTPPADVLSPTSLVFAAQKVGTSSAVQTVTLTNPINGLSTPLTIASIATVGADFAISSNTCGGSLAAGTSCTIGITFTPTTTGPLTGLLAVFDDSPNPQRGVTLSGTGQ